LKAWLEPSQVESLNGLFYKDRLKGVKSFIKPILCLLVAHIQQH